eukprot:comp24120_c10_seq1/m.43726 comp24120_c10_seq1/g.43726  ORF comp24120_c10_seq1/g.43726 comp24120_c10_seq1/m.43726 type:complete len:457 (-) comp24120_c10_seq1:466-1836(-)
MDAFTAAQLGDKVMVQRHIDKAVEPDICDAHGFSLVHWAAWKGQTELLQFLKEKRFDMKRKNNGGDTALHISASKGHLAAAVKLLELGLDPNDPNEHGNTPLHYAILWGHVDIAKKLIEKGGEIRRLNKYGDSPIKRAGKDENMLDEYARSLGVWAEDVEYKETHNFGVSFATIALRHVKLRLDFHSVRIGEVLGDGPYTEASMGIFKGQNVVFKRLKNSSRLAEAQMQELLDEIERIRTLEPMHPNVLPVLGIVDTQPDEGAGPVPMDIMLVTQHVPRGSLYGLIGAGQLPADERVQVHMALDIVRAMAYLHALSPPVLYWHLQSPSIMVDQRLNLMLCMGDCGFSFNSMLRLCEYAPQWMAPEVLEDPLLQGPKSDVYSYGVVLNEIFSRTHPYEGMPRMACGLKVVYEELRPEIADDVVPTIRKICGLCWQTNADSRPAFSELLPIFEAMYLA